MIIELYGLATCSRCKTARMMLEKRNIKFKYITVAEHSDELPILVIDKEKFSAKEALLKIRSL